MSVTSNAYLNLDTLLYVIRDANLESLGLRSSLLNRSYKVKRMVISILQSAEKEELKEVINFRRPHKLNVESNCRIENGGLVIVDNKNSNNSISDELRACFHRCNSNLSVADEEFVLFSLTNVDFSLWPETVFTGVISEESETLFACKGSVAKTLMGEFAICEKINLVQLSSNVNWIIRNSLLKFFVSDENAGGSPVNLRIDSNYFTVAPGKDMPRKRASRASSSPFANVSFASSVILVSK